MGGDSGRKGRNGCQGTCIRVTRTKPNGVGLRVGGGDGYGRDRVRGWNGDNCTWTAIKRRISEDWMYSSVTIGNNTI